MHTNLNKTERKVLYKGRETAKRKARKPRNFCIIYWNFVPQTKESKRYENQEPSTLVRNCMKCVSIFLLLRGAPCCIILFGLCAFIFHLHEFFIVFSDTKGAAARMHLTLHGIKDKHAIFVSGKSACKSS